MVKISLILTNANFEFFENDRMWGLVDVFRVSCCFFFCFFLFSSLSLSFMCLNVVIIVRGKGPAFFFYKSEEVVVTVVEKSTETTL